MKSILNEKGISMVEVLAATAIIGVAISIAMQMIWEAGQGTKRIRLYSTRERIINSLANFASMPAALRASTIPEVADEPFNESFKDCMLGGRAGSCLTRNAVAGAPPVYLGFRLYLPVVTNILPEVLGGNAGFNTSGAITGVPTYPMRYNDLGKMCDTSTSTCLPSLYPLEAFTEFMPFCWPNFQMAWHGFYNQAWSGPVYPDGLDYYPSCDGIGARYVKVRLTIRPSGGTVANFNPLVLTFYIDAVLARNARQ